MHHRSCILSKMNEIYLFMFFVCFFFLLFLIKLKYSHRSGFTKLRFYALVPLLFFRRLFFSVLSACYRFFFHSFTFAINKNTNNNQKYINNFNICIESLLKMNKSIQFSDVKRFILIFFSVHFLNRSIHFSCV